MFNNIGGKIKGLAVTICALGIIAAVIFGMFFFIIPALQDGNFGGILLGLLIIGAGSIAAWIGSFFTYGFGELIEKATIIADNSQIMDKVEDDQEPDQYQTPYPTLESNKDINSFFKTDGIMDIPKRPK